MHLIVIDGQTCTGKTPLAQRLGDDLHIKICRKDDYIEQYYDALPNKPTWRQLYKAEQHGWKTLYQVVQAAIQDGSDLLIEGFFMAGQKKQLRKLAASHRSQLRASEIFLYTRGFISFRRYYRRNSSGERHVGHRDTLWYATVWTECLCATLGWRWIQPMNLSADILKVNANDFAAVDYDAIRLHLIDKLRG